MKTKRKNWKYSQLKKRLYLLVMVKNTVVVPIINITIYQWKLKRTMVITVISWLNSPHPWDPLPPEWRSRFLSDCCTETGDRSSGWRWAMFCRSVCTCVLFAHVWHSHARSGDTRSYKFGCTGHRGNPLLASWSLLPPFLPPQSPPWVLPVSQHLTSLVFNSFQLQNILHK